MNRRACAVIVPAAVLLMTLPVWAHHSISSTFDELKPLTVTGVVAEIRFENPHIVLLLDVADATGRVSRWTFEGSAPTALVRGGYRRDAIKIGARVTIKGAHARDESVNFGIAREVLLEDGRSFVFGPKSADGTR